VKVLVTGASGFIGSALCDALLARGDSVVGLTRDPQRARSTNPSVVWHAWQPMLERPPAEAFEGVDGVVNLLGEKINQRWSDEAKRRIMESRRTGTHNLIGTIAGLKKKPKVLVNQAAIGFYGDRGEAIVDESSGPGEGYDSVVVQEWEKAAHEVEGSGVRLVVVRTGHVLDAKDGLLAELLTPFKLGVGGPLAGGSQYMSWIHIEDEVGILLWALDNEKASGTINATAPNPVTNRELSKAIGRAINRPAVMPVPGLVLDLKFGSEFGQVLRGGQRVMPRRALDLGYSFRFTDVDSALADLLR
jgi:uncharacterized protein (TIGR01777 family)